MNRLLIYRDCLPPEKFAGIVVSFEEVKQWLRYGVVKKHLFAYSEVIIYCRRISLLRKPYRCGLIAWMFGRYKALFRDEVGGELSITWWRLISWSLPAFKDFLSYKSMLRKLTQEITALEDTSERAVADFSRFALYLRMDFFFGIASGGSLTHIAGVANNLADFMRMPTRFITTDEISTVDRSIETVILQPEWQYAEYLELPELWFNGYAVEQILTHLKGDRPGLIYQRYAVENFVGVALARRLNIPLILEYNGSEIWVSNNWGEPLQYEALAQRIEMLNLKAADLITVVSRPLFDELCERGIEPEKILINANAVNPEQYHPDLDGSPVRKKLGVD
ncbi:glycosyltransferase, partial [Magnetococcales bacterium HHB-1]